MAMSCLSPRNKLLADPIAVKRYREFIDDPLIQEAMQGVMIEFMRSNPTQEACRGANHFVETLTGYAETPKPAKAWPDHSRLTHPDSVKPDKKSTQK
jgi:hypothetical protein